MCHSCPRNTFSLGGVENCTACGDAGFSEPGAASCTPCNPGEELDNTTHNRERCTSCESGFVASAPGTAHCTLCIAGRTSDRERRNCRMCAPGSVAPSGTVEGCIACEAGKYANHTISECHGCEPGRFGATPGLSTHNCSGECFPGEYSVRYASACTACDRGRYTRSSGAEFCDYCAQSMTSEANASECVAERGFVYGRVVGSAQFLHPCPEGATCDIESGATTHSLKLYPGWWRSTELSLKTLRCKDTTNEVGGGDDDDEGEEQEGGTEWNLGPYERTKSPVCVGGASEGLFGESVCKSGTRGPYCAVCTAGYVKQSGECVPCAVANEGASLWRPLALLGAFLLTLLSSFIFVAYASEYSRRTRSLPLVVADDASESPWNRELVEKMKLRGAKPDELLRAVAYVRRVRSEEQERIVASKVQADSSDKSSSGDAVVPLAPGEVGDDSRSTGSNTKKRASSEDAARGDENEIQTFLRSMPTSQLISRRSLLTLTDEYRRHIQYTTDRLSSEVKEERVDKVSGASKTSSRSLKQWMSLRRPKDSGADGSGGVRKAASSRITSDGFFGWVDRLALAQRQRRRRANGVVERIKITVSFMQIAWSFFEAFEVNYPPSFAAAMELMSVVNLDVFRFFSLGCFVIFDYHHELLAATLLPVVIGLGVAAYVAYTLRLRRLRWRRERAERSAGSEEEKPPANTGRRLFYESANYLVNALIVCHTEQPNLTTGVSRTIFKAFKCERFMTALYTRAECEAQGFAWAPRLDDESGGEGCYRSYLRADYSVSCDEPEHTPAAAHMLWVAYAWIAVFVYPLGVPMVFGRMLWGVRHQMAREGEEDARDEDEEILKSHEKHGGSVGTRERHKQRLRRQERERYTQQDDEVQHGRLVSCRRAARRLAERVPSSWCKFLACLCCGCRACLRCCCRHGTDGTDGTDGADRDGTADLDSAAVGRKLMRLDDEEDLAQHLGFLHQAYERNYYWWEMVELGRKLLLSVLVIFFLEGSATQITATLLVSFVALLVLQTYQPYKSALDDRAAVVAQVELIITAFGALMLKIEVVEDDAWNVATFDVLLSITVVALPIFTLGELVSTHVMPPDAKRRFWDGVVAVLQNGRGRAASASLSKKVRPATFAAVTPVEKSSKSVGEMKKAKSHTFAFSNSAQEQVRRPSFFSAARHFHEWQDVDHKSDRKRLKAQERDNAQLRREKAAIASDHNMNKQQLLAQKRENAELKRKNEELKNKASQRSTSDLSTRAQQREEITRAQKHLREEYESSMSVYAKKKQEERERQRLKHEKRLASKKIASARKQEWIVEDVDGEEKGE